MWFIDFILNIRDFLVQSNDFSNEWPMETIVKGNRFSNAKFSKCGALDVRLWA